MGGGSDYHKLDKALAEGKLSEELRALSKYGSTGPQGYPTFYRYVVLDTVFDPYRVDQAKMEYWEHDLGVTNIKFAGSPPRNAIIARRIRSSTSSQDEATLMLYPFFPPTLSFPCKPGEHVWVMFEDREGLKPDLGYWFCRIVQPGFVEDANHTHPPRRDDPSFQPGTKDIYDGQTQAVYEFRNGPVYLKNGERYTDGEGAPVNDSEDVYRRLLLDSDGGLITKYEPVPRFVKRPGDVAIEGTNNTLIVLGRDRVGPAAEYGPNQIADPEGTRGDVPNIPLSDAKDDGAGMIDLVAGRGQTPLTGGSVVENDLPTNEIGKSKLETVENEGDPDLANDRSRIMIAQRTLVDTNLGLQGFNSEHGAGPFQGTAQTPTSVTDHNDTVEGDGAIVIKTDKVRIIARSDIEFLVMGYTRDEEGNMVTDEDTSHWAAVVVKANGDIVMRPAAQGFIKLGSDSADKAIICTDFPAIAEDGNVTAEAIHTTMAGQFGGTGKKTQGAYASKILVDGPTRK